MVATTANTIEQFKQATLATSRTLSQHQDLELEFVDDRESITTQGQVAQPTAELLQDDVSKARGMADGLALRLRYHDVDLHLGKAPRDQLQRAIYDAAEQARYEILGSQGLSGVSQNLMAAYEHWLGCQGFLNVLETETKQCPAVIYLFLHEQLGGATSNQAQPLMELWRQQMMPLLECWRQPLNEALGDQQLFAGRVRQLLAEMSIAHSFDMAQAPESLFKKVDQKSVQEESLGQENSSDEGRDRNASSDGELQTADTEKDGQEVPGAGTTATVNENENENANVKREASYAKSEAAEAYRIYTDEYDRVVNIADLFSQGELLELRQLIDQRMKGEQASITRLANRLQRYLLSHQARIALFDQEEGILDTARLSRLIAKPLDSLCYKNEGEVSLRDTVLTLLIDNSASMRGRPIMMAALCAEILSRTLESCGVKVEVLGFTTAEWRGGECRRRWLAEGKPPNPGRLNELMHLVYKSANTPWRRARYHFGAMLEPNLLKENIDGEALLWAHQRLLARPESRRLLMIVSDGLPIDEATLGVNSKDYLENHLRQSIAFIEKRSQVELLAIGIGHDVSPFYRRAVTLDDLNKLGATLMSKVIELLET